MTGTENAIYPHQWICANIDEENRLSQADTQRIYLIRVYALLTWAGTKSCLIFQVC